MDIDPENTPDIPKEQRLLSIDFVSQYFLGTQMISVKEKFYYTQLQRLMNETGTKKEIEEPPNYVQVSDRRPENERGGWQLSVMEKEQFKDDDGRELLGAILNLLNSQLVTIQSGKASLLQAEKEIEIVSENKRVLVSTERGKARGTWIYRFGDYDQSSRSVALFVPQYANQVSTIYSTKLIWELSEVPDN